MGKSEKKQEKVIQKVGSTTGEDFKQSQKNVDRSNKKVFKADGQNDE